MEGYRVLLVEDEPIIALDVMQRLERLGHSTAAHVTSGHDAIARVREDAPDVVLMDIVLDGPLDGIETARQLRAIAQFPLLYLTAHGEDEALERAKETDPDGYLLKPLTDRELRVALELAVHRYRRGRRKESPAPGAEPPGGPSLRAWHFDSSRAVLETPTGVSLALTAAESILVDALFGKPGENVPRDLLFAKLDYPNDSYGNQRLEALVSRLRAKVRSADPANDLPIHSRRLLGYAFLADT